MAMLDNIRPLVEARLASLGMELYDMVFHPAGRHSVLRIYIDKPAGVTIDDCETASTEISMLLDVENFMNSPYTLEVSSPGLDRPLMRPKDFRRAVGHSVVLDLRTPDGKLRQVRGTMEAYNDDTLTVETGGSPVVIPVSDVKSGKIEINFK